MAVTQPGPSGLALVAALEAARSELQADILRGAGGRSALERYSDRVDAMLRQLFADAGGRRTSSSCSRSAVMAGGICVCIRISTC